MDQAWVTVDGFSSLRVNVLSYAGEIYWHDHSHDWPPGLPRDAHSMCRPLW